MKKRVVIGDVHGHSSWEEIYRKEDPDEFIMLGDYVDGFQTTPEEQLKNLNRIFQVQEEHFRKKNGMFLVLMGNHDLHYTVYGEFYSGYKDETRHLVNEVFLKALKGSRMRLIWPDYENKIIYSHAGVTNTWFKKHIAKKDFSYLSDINNYQDITDLDKFRFVGSNIYGDDPANSPLWVRPRSLMLDPFDGTQFNEDDCIWSQVVGHTHCDEPIVHPLFGDKTLTLLDCMPHYYMVQNLEYRIQSTNFVKFK